MKSINYKFHVFVGYLLFPIRFITFVSSTLLTIGSLVIVDKIGYNTLGHSLYMNYVKFSIQLFGLTIHSEGLEHLTDKPCIIVSNHINLYDHYVMTNTLGYLPPYIVSGKFNFRPINIIFNFMKCIYTEHKKGYVVEKMKERIKEGGQITIYPDGCNPIPFGKLISPFRSGAFVPKAPIQPIVIRYVPSSNTNMNWYYEDSSKDNTPFSLLKSYLQDGDMHVYVKVLPLQEYKDSYKSHEDYRDDVYELMTKELSTLPEQKPNLVVGETSGEYTMKSLLRIPLTLAIISHFIGFYHHCSWMYLLFISSYFCHYYPTKNTILFDRLVTPYSVYAGLFVSLDIPEWYIDYDYYVRCMFAVLMCVSGVSFYMSKLYINYTEKEHIMKVWAPGYSITIYNILVYMGINLI